MPREITSESVRKMAELAGLEITQKHMDIVIRQLKILEDGLSVVTDELLENIEPFYNMTLPKEEKDG